MHVVGQKGSSEASPKSERSRKSWASNILGLELPSSASFMARDKSGQAPSPGQRRRCLISDFHTIFCTERKFEPSDACRLSSTTVKHESFSIPLDRVLSGTANERRSAVGHNADDLLCPRQCFSLKSTSLACSANLSHTIERPRDVKGYCRGSLTAKLSPSLGSPILLFLRSR